MAPLAPSLLEARHAAVRQRVAAAAERAGRSPADIEIVAVTKGQPDGVLRAVAAAGLTCVGENRVAEAEAKLGRVGRLGLCWHMIGHVQRNKAARVVQLFDELESLDSLRLAETLQRELESAGRTPFPVLVQVNTSGEAAKGGFEASDPEGVRETVEHVRRLCRLPSLRVRGLMTMAPLTSEESVLRSTFRRARQLFERCGQEVDEFEGAVLSMGMSNDFEIAIEEGSTRLRLGTILVGERPDP
jgi:pyridoxal phosphate enzyme (YggS family)